ncbi:hypothetical protein P7K49_009950 [Saguinus oedipus]|uniref:Uncharacterized protein n=1 Tax=Saguinus oedipus TaxID=9490 RepID=A0ABQ9VLE3_SAGOE|nr:hypothetical protein P7K49_009950 [Saguinus oedipus]
MLRYGSHGAQGLGWSDTKPASLQFQPFPGLNPPLGTLGRWPKLGEANGFPMVPTQLVQILLSLVLQVQPGDPPASQYLHPHPTSRTPLLCWRERTLGALRELVSLVLGNDVPPQV